MEWLKLFSCCVVLLATMHAITCKPKSRVNQERFDMKIEERGTEFLQEVDLMEEAEGIVAVHVPQHNDVDETYYITDTKSHLTMRVAPQQKMCFLTKNDPEELPAAEVWRKTRDAVRLSVVSNQQLEKKETVYRVGNRLSDTETASLPHHMRTSCSAFPVINIYPIYSSTGNTGGPTFSKDNFTFIDLPKREKRHAGDGGSVRFIDECHPDKIKQKCLLRQHGCKYAYDRICDTHVDVSGRESTQCNLRHWSGQVICCKPCCLDRVPEGNPSLYCHDKRLHRDAICE